MEKSGLTEGCGLKLTITLSKTLRCFSSKPVCSINMQPVLLINIACAIYELDLGINQQGLFPTLEAHVDLYIYFKVC